MPWPPPPWMHTIGYGFVTVSGASHWTKIWPRGTVPCGRDAVSPTTQKNPRREVMSSPSRCGGPLTQLS